MVQTTFNLVEILFWFTYGTISVIAMIMVGISYSKIYSIVQEFKQFSNEIATQIVKKFTISLVLGFVIGVFVYKYFLSAMLYNVSSLQENSFYFNMILICIVVYLLPLYFVSGIKGIEVDSYILAKARENDLTNMVVKEIERIKNAVEVTGYGIGFLLGVNFISAVILGMFALLMSVNLWRGFYSKNNTN